MPKRFQGPEGLRRLLDALREQEIVLGDIRLAEELHSVLELRQFEPGDEIIKQGDSNSDLWLLLTGKATICVNGREVATRDARTHVGEMALLDYASGRCASVRADTQVVAGKIADEDFNKIANQYPALWKNLAKKLALRLRELNNSIRPHNNPPRLFIASSQEDLAIAEEFRRELSQDGLLDVKIWKSSKEFVLSHTTIEDLTDKSGSVDFALLILGENDRVLVRGEEKSAPRDNVVFELGLFMGTLGLDRTFMLCVSETKLPTDILGLTVIRFEVGDPASLSDRVKSACKDIRGRIAEIGAR